MNKNEAWVKVGSSVAAAMIGYLVISLVASQMEVFWKIVTVSIVGIVALVIAFWGGRKAVPIDKPKPKSEIGTKIKAEGSVSLEDAKVVMSSNGDALIGSDISSKENVTIKGVHVDQKGK